MPRPSAVATETAKASSRVNSRRPTWDTVRRHPAAGVTLLARIHSRQARTLLGTGSNKPARSTRVKMSSEIPSKLRPFQQGLRASESVAYESRVMSLALSANWSTVQVRLYGQLPIAQTPGHVTLSRLVAKRPSAVAKEIVLRIPVRCTTASPDNCQDDS